MAGHKYTTQRWRIPDAQSIPSTAALRIFQGRPLETAAEREASDVRAEQSQLKVEREARKEERHLRAVKRAVGRNRKRRDKRRRLKKSFYQSHADYPASRA